MSDAVSQLRAAVDAIRANLLAQGFEQPELAVDTDGHYILLPALVALVIAEAKAQAALAIRPGQTLIVSLPLGTDRQTLDGIVAQVKTPDPGFRIMFFTGVEHMAVAETG